MAADRIESQLKRLSTGPGVYILRDAKGDVLYVGKAKSLRPRVRSYFQAGSSDTRQGIRKRMREIAVLEFRDGLIASLREYWASESLGDLNGSRSGSGG